MTRNTTTRTIPGGTAHELPDDFRKAILSDKKVLALWQDITPLARNEWICWVITVKQAATRTKHITVALDKMRKCERRPCCWSGCIHRTDKAMSPSQKWVNARASK